MINPGEYEEPNSKLQEPNKFQIRILKFKIRNEMQSQRRNKIAIVQATENEKAAAK
jgi:hypothetical protein